jgi:capsular exopolysaccharide synthesis family protein
MIRAMVSADRAGKGFAAGRWPAELSGCYGALARQVRSRRNGSPEGGQLIGVTSCRRREGVSTVAANLAIAVARSGLEPTLLIDANTDHPAIAALFQLRNAPGLAELAGQDADVGQCIRPSPTDGLSILPAGDAKGVAGAPDARAFAQLLRELRRNYEFIAVDLPPANELSACLALAGTLDGVVLVVEAERVRSEAVLRAKQQLVHVDANLVGVVFNKRKQRRWEAS